MRADWSRAMIYKSIEPGNDVTCHAVPVVLFLVLRKRKKINVIVKNKSTRIWYPCGKRTESENQTTENTLD